jgi:hypothetical protein
MPVAFFGGAPVGALLEGSLASQIGPVHTFAIALGGARRVLVTEFALGLVGAGALGFGGARRVLVAELALGRDGAGAFGLGALVARWSPR